MTSDFKRMLDTIHSTVERVPNSIDYVGGYTTGTPDIEWTADDWNRFAHSTHVRIWQGFAGYTALDSFDVIDVESGAVTPQEAVDTVVARVRAGIGWTTIYGTDAALAEVERLSLSLSNDVWIGHVNAWLANWNLDEEHAAALLGTFIHGMTCVAVQWASPTSNPVTIVYGGEAELQQCDADLSVVLPGYIPSYTAPVDTPPPPPVAVHSGYLVTNPSGGELAGKLVQSTDGVNWH